MGVDVNLGTSKLLSIYSNINIFVDKIFASYMKSVEI